MTERAAERSRFLDTSGWGGAEITALPSDASFRRYFRLKDGSRHAMLMDAPPPRENVGPFLRIAGLLHDLNLSAPRILAQDEPAGFLILEDLGDATYTRLIADGHDEAALYDLAADALAELHRRFDQTTAPDLPPYSDALLLQEAALLTDWFLPEATAKATSPQIAEEYLSLWREILPLARNVPQSLVLRDFHIDNLMLLENRPGVQACGLLDFQDAVLGPVTYDIVSLIEDARRDVPDEIAGNAIRRYLAAHPQIDPVAFTRSLAILGAQRHAKVIGIFCRLMRRDGKPVYLRHLPRVWRMLDRSLGSPALAEIASARAMRAWMEHHIPAKLRTIPARFANPFF